MDRYPLNQAVISQVLFDLRNGQLRHALEMGFTEEDIRLLTDAEKVSTLLNSSVSWLEVKVNKSILNRLLNRTQEVEQEIALIDQMLLLGASSQMICDVFGLTQREVAFRKRVIGAEEKKGRWKELSELQDHAMWKIWKEKIQKYKLDNRNLMDMIKVCMVLAKEGEVPMAMVWKAMEKWLAAENKTP